MNEIIFFDEKGIKVTNTYFIVNGKSTNIADIVEVSTQYKKKSKFWPITVIVVSWALVAMAGVGALIVMILGIYWLIKQKSGFYIEYKTSYGKKSEVIDKDGSFINRLFNALEKALDFDPKDI